MDKEPLLKNLSDLKIKSEINIPSDKGYYPLERPILEYIKYGIVTLDKPQNPSSHEVSTWIKNILDVEKTGHCGTLDPQVSGVLTVCIERATRLVKCQQHAGKQYVCVIEFSEKVCEEKFKKVLKSFEGELLQRPPLMSAVKRNLRLRTVYKIEFIEYMNNIGLFKVDCQAGTYIRTLCNHIGLKMGVSAEMKELRRTRSGISDESQCVTMHDLLDAFTEFKNNKNEKLLKKVIRPLEFLLADYKRIIIKDSCVEAICHGSKLAIKGILRYDGNLSVGSKVVMVSSKGEAVAIGVMRISSSQIELLDSGFACDIERVIMERGNYYKYWKNNNDFEIYSD